MQLGFLVCMCVCVSFGIVIIFYSVVLIPIFVTLYLLQNDVRHFTFAHYLGYNIKI